MIAQLDNAYWRASPRKALKRLIAYLLFEGRPLTTRGRWINPLVFAHFRIAKWLPQMRAVNQPIFILGTGRSGTTILGTILSLHNDIGFLNEPKALWYSVNPNDDLIGSYSCEGANYRLDASDVTDSIQSSAHRLYGAYLAISGSGRVLDKYPEMIFRVPYLKAIFPDSKFVFIVRNGWDTCRSIDRWSKRLGTDVRDEKHDWWGVDQRKWRLLIEQIIPKHIDLAPYAGEMLGWTDHKDMAAVEWIVSMREGLDLMQRHPDDILKVKYEDLCRSPREVLGEIVAHVDINPNDEKVFGYANETLVPAMTRRDVEIHPYIAVAFGELMRRLEYHDN